MVDTTHSPQFHTLFAAGDDWRDTSKTILEAFKALKDRSKYTFGFLYMTDMLAEDASGILNLFKSVTGIESWVGSCGFGVFANGTFHVDKPAISVMLCNIAVDDVVLLPSIGYKKDDIEKTLAPFLAKHEPMLALVHGDPSPENDPAQALDLFGSTIEGFVAGGMASSRTDHVHFAGELSDDILSGCVFARTIPVATTLSQGCTAIGPVHTITKCDENVIIEIDDKSPFDVFHQDIKHHDTLKFTATDDTPESEWMDLFLNGLHVAFPVQGSDQDDFLVRNIIGLDKDAQSMAVGQHIAKGERIMFAYRDGSTIASELSSALLKLRKRIAKEHGECKPAGALYISCLARAVTDNDEITTAIQQQEVQTIQTILGDIPLTGYTANGEIAAGRFYGYTGVLILFL